jgi:hypothetical protein
MLERFCKLWARGGFRIALVALVAVVGLFAVLSGTERALQGSSEFRDFRQIVQVSIVQNKDHYAVISHLRAYPPFFAIFWAPYGLFPWGALPDEAHPLVGSSLSQKLQIGASAVLVMLVMTALSVWAARCIMSAGLPRDKGGSGWCGTALLGVLSGGLMANAIFRCETDMFVVMMVAGAMYLILARGRHWSGGALLGVAAAFKLTPGLFGVYLLCRRKWTALAGMALGGFVCTVVLPVLIWGPQGAWQRQHSWFDEVIVPYATEGAESFIGRAYRDINQSPKAALVRYLTHSNAGKENRPRYLNVADLPMSTVNAIATGLKALILAGLVVAWVVPRPRATPGLEVVLFALVPLGMLLLSDVSHGSHLAILAVPLGGFVGVAHLHAGEALGKRMTWGILAGFLAANLIAVRSLKEMSVATLGMFILYGLGLYVAYRLVRAERATPVPENP